MGISQASRPHNLLTGRFGICECNVFTHRAAEQQWILRNNADLATQGIQLDLGDVIAIDQDSTLTRLIQARQQLHQRALATAALADDADEGPRLDLEVDILEHLRLSRTEAEGEALKPHITLQGRQHHLRFVDLIGLLRRVDHISQSLEADSQFLNVLPDRG